jgi:hypothetical protein
MHHAVDLFLEETAYLLCDGYSINTGFFTASVHIKGVFSSPNDTFDPNKHTIVFEFHQGEEMRKRLSNIAVDILGLANSSLSIAQVIDVYTKSVNDLLTVYHNLKIAGYKIKIAGDNPANGIYFINQTNGERTPVDESDMVVNNPSELIVMIPNLNAGTYKLEITTQYTPSNLLKEPHSVIFDKILTVS